MEYLQYKKYFPFKTVVIDDSLQITLVEKNKCQVSFVISSISLFVQLLFLTSWKLKLDIFHYKYSFWTRWGRQIKIKLRHGQGHIKNIVEIKI